MALVGCRFRGRSQKEKTDRNYKSRQKDQSFIHGWNEKHPSISDQNDGKVDWSNIEKSKSSEAVMGSSFLIFPMDCIDDN